MLNPVLLLRKLKELLHRDCFSGRHHQQACQDQVVKDSTSVVHGKQILERYHGTQPLKTMLFHVLSVSVLEFCATAEQRVCVHSFPLLPHCLQPVWAWFHGDRQSQCETDMAESGMSAADDRPRLAEEADPRVANSKGKPTDTTKLVSKQRFKSIMTKGANTSNLATDMWTCSKSFKSCRLAIDNKLVNDLFYISTSNIIIACTFVVIYIIRKWSD